jgi:hypothetical protein
MASKEGITLLRAILSELRAASPNGTIKDSLATQYVLKQFRKYDTTDLQVCKAKEEVIFVGRSYLAYLQSLKNMLKIQKEYQGKGDRSIRDTANIVGFKLPHDPK